MKTKAKFQQELDDIRAVIPEGYLIAKDTLAESVALMVAGLRAYSKERQELLAEIQENNRAICYYENNANQKTFS